MWKQVMADWKNAVVLGGTIGAFVVGGFSFIYSQEKQQKQNIPKPNNTTQTSPFQINISNDSNNSSNNSSNNNSNNSSNNSTEQQSNPPKYTAPPDVTSPQNNPSPKPTISISQQEAVDIVRSWLEAKKELFAPPYNRQLGAELTTGEAYRKNIGPGSSLEWLEKDNAYYRYGVQKIDSVKKFVANGDQATIEVVVTEDRKYYHNQKLINNEHTAFSTSLDRYSLRRENGLLKIAEYSTVK